MVKRNTGLLANIFLLILLLFVSSPVFAQAGESGSQLVVSVASAEKQWGQFLRVTLRYHGLESLREIDLQSWRQLVAVDFDDLYIDEDEYGNPVQLMLLRLQPRKTGAFQLPSLQLGMAHSQPIAINIRQPVIKNSPIKLDWQISTLSPWQREAVLLRVQLLTSDYAAHIKLDAPEYKQFLLRALKTERQVLPDGRYRFDAGWVFYPVDAGPLELDLPPLRYQIAGSDRRRFYLPLQKMQVKALPNYLPPTLPVGRLNVNSQISEDNEGNKQWQLSIKSDALIPYGVPGLDAQLAAISEHDIANLAIKYTQQSGYHDYGDRSLYSLPLPDWLMPFGKDLKLTLRYFDTGSGRLSEVSHNLPRHWNMPAWAWWLAAMFSFIIAAFVFYQLQPWLRLQAIRLKIYFQLRKAESIKQMRRIILDCGQYVALSDWGKNNPARRDVIRQLNEYCFSASVLKSITLADVQKLKKVLLKLV